jgi:predicted RecA/RadA family phage recombinase
MPQAILAHEGRHIDYTPATAVAAGDVVVQNGRVAGVANVDIEAGRQGALAVEGVFDFTKLNVGTSFTVGENLYWDDLNDRAVSTGAGNAYLGKCVRPAADTETRVRVKLAALQDATLIYSADGASNSVTNTITETAFNKSVTIPANRLKKGDVIRVRGQGIVTNQNATDTLTIQLKLGGTAGVQIVTTGAIDPATNDIFYIEADLVVRTVGVAGTIVATGLQALGTPGTVTGKPFLKASTLVDTTITQDLIVSATWSAASAANIVRLDVFDVELLSR